MSKRARLRTRIKAAFRPLYDDYIHPLRCRWYQRHQEHVDATWIEAETDRLLRVKLVRDKAFANECFWEEARRTASSTTYRATAQVALDECTKLHLDAASACIKIEREINRVHARRNYLGTRPQPTAARSSQLVASPAI